MSSLVNSLQHLSSSWSWIIWLFLTIGLVLMVLVVFLVARAITRSKEQKNPEDKAKTHLFGMLNDDLKYGEKLPMKGRLGEKLALKGIFKAGDFSTAFLKAVTFLRDHLGGRGAEYIFPWYLMLGPTGAGKTTLLEGSGLNLPVGRPDFEGMGDESACNWWLFDRSVILDIRGEFVLHRTGLTSDEKKWHLLLLLLQRYRTKRPIDGVVLTLPADELMGPTQLDPAETLGRAKQLYNKLSQIQDVLGVAVPVYVMVTKCDTIPGFQSYSSLIPAIHHQQMFGWSNPHGVQDPFESGWVDEAFHEVDKTLEKISLEVFSREEADEAIRDEAYQFPQQLQRVQESLSVYLQSIFKYSSFREPFILRGIYFSGQGTGTDQATSTDDSSDLSAFSPYPQMAAYKAESLYGQAKVPQYFVRDFFSQKVFREYSLAKPIAARQRADYRSTLMTRASIIAVVGLVGVGGFHDYTRLLHLKESLLPALYQMQQILKEEVDSKGKNPAALNQKIAMQTQILLHLMSRVHDTSFATLFLMPSWFSGLNDLVGKTLAIGYEQIIAQSVHDQFKVQFKKIMDNKVSIQAPESTATGPAAQAAVGKAAAAQVLSHDKLLSELTDKASRFDPQKIPEFTHLQTYVEQIIEFEQFLAKYNLLINSADQTALSEVTEYLFGFSLPRESLEYLRKFKASKHFGGHRQIDVKIFAKDAKHQLQTRYQAYVKAVMELGKYYKPLTDLVQELKTFTSQAHDSIDNVKLAHMYRNISLSIKTAVDFINTSSLSWIESPTFNPGDQYTALMLRLSETSALLGAVAAESLIKEASTNFEVFRQQLVSLGSPISGPFFASAKGQLQAQSSENLSVLKHVLAEFFEQPFMAVVDDASIETVVSHDKRLIWDANALSHAGGLIDAFELFVGDKLLKYPKELQETLKIMGIEHLERHLNYQLKQGQTYINASKALGNAALEEELRTLVPNVSASTTYLGKILAKLAKGASAESYIRLRDLLASQASLVLNTLDQLLKNEKLYGFSGENFDWWDGTKGAGFRAYSVKDAQDMQKYFDVQRARITSLAKEFAEPTLRFLQIDALKGADLNVTLMSRWSRILEQLESYDKKKPDNTIVSLENYIFTEANDLSFTNCFDKIPDPITSTIQGDYFEQKRLEIMKAAQNKCKSTSYQATVDFYKKLSDSFNTNLAGKFPFVSAEATRYADTAPQEVSVEDLKSFLTIAQGLTPSMLHMIDVDPRFKASKSAVSAFLKRVNEIQELFKPFMAGDPGQDAPMFMVGAEFRVNQAQEVSANQIIEYDAEFGEGQKLTQADVGKTVAWKVGTPITLSFKWAEGGNSMPSSDSKQHHLSTHAYSANFYYSNQWSLLMALYSQAASQGDFSSSADATPHVLKFEIPTTSGGKPDDDSSSASSASTMTKVYVRLILSVPLSTGAKVVRIASLPVSAPALDIDADAAPASGSSPDAAKPDADKPADGDAAKPDTDTPADGDTGAPAADATSDDGSAGAGDDSTS
jgi:type VI secretion system protein ImpL